MFLRVGDTLQTNETQKDSVTQLSPKSPTLPRVGTTERCFVPWFIPLEQGLTLCPFFSPLWVSQLELQQTIKQSIIKQSNNHQQTYTIQY